MSAIGDVGDDMFILCEGDVDVSKTLILNIGRGTVETRDKAVNRAVEDCHRLH